MEIVEADVAIVGAGGAGLRAAIALAQTDPTLKIALVSKVYPMRSHTCAAEGGAAGVVKPDDSYALHFDDTVGGGDWLSDQDCVEYFVHEAPKELMQFGIAVLYRIAGKNSGPGLQRTSLDFTSCTPCFRPRCSFPRSPGTTNTSRWTCWSTKAVARA